MMRGIGELASTRIWIAVVGIMGSSSIASAQSDHWSSARDAAKAGDHKKALQLYAISYDEPYRKHYKATIAHFAVISAVALKNCDQYKKWIRRTEPKDYPVTEHGTMEAKCARSKPNDNPPQPPVKPDPPRIVPPPDPIPAPVPPPVDPPATGLLIIDSNLSGVLASGFPVGTTFQDGPAVGLSVPENGFHLPTGKVTLSLPNGTHMLRMVVPEEQRNRSEIQPMIRDIQVKPGVPAHLNLNWEPFFSEFTWHKLSTTGRSYDAISNKPFDAGLSIFFGIITIGGGIALYATCGTNVNGSCDETWKQGLSYTGASVFAVTGFVGFIRGIYSATIDTKKQRARPFTDSEGKLLRANDQ